MNNYQHSAPEICIAHLFKVVVAGTGLRLQVKVCHNLETSIKICDSWSSIDSVC